MATGERFATDDLTTALIEVCKNSDIGRRADQLIQRPTLSEAEETESVRLVIREN